MKGRPLLPVEVEPFSEARWGRVERDTFAELDAHPPAYAGSGGRRRVGIWALTIATAVAAAVAFVVTRSPRGRGDDTLRLATSESASRFTVGESALDVEPHSLVLVRGEDEHGIDVTIDHGTVEFEVAPRKGRPPFIVDAGEVHVRVVGTGFRVTYVRGETAVDVLHGVVEVVSRGVVTTLHDGGRWPAEPAAKEEPRAAPEPSTPPFSPPAGFAPPERIAPSTGSSPFMPPPSRADPGASGRLRLAPSGSTAPPEPRPSGAASSAPSPPPPVLAGGGASSPSAPSGVGASSGASAADLYDNASRIERTRPDDAAAIYRQLSASDTRWAENASFALARLEADRGRRAEATRLLRAYLARYPRGMNVEDARELLRQLR